MNLKEQKDALRKEAYTKRKKLFSNTITHQKLSLKIQNHILNSHEYTLCEFLCVYASVKGEVATDYLIEEAFKTNKKVLFPLCLPHENGVMHYALCKSNNDLQKGLYHIPEPKSHCPVIETRLLNSRKNLIIVPALAFDKQGFRLGYGQGYYDRFMEKTPNAISMGLAFSDHIYEELPRMQWDKSVNFLITEQKIKTLHTSNI